MHSESIWNEFDNLGEVVEVVAALESSIEQAKQSRQYQPVTKLELAKRSAITDVQLFPVKAQNR